MPDADPSGCAGMMTVSVPCGFDQSTPAVTGPGSVTVSVNEPCGGTGICFAELQFCVVVHIIHAAVTMLYWAPAPGAASASV